MTVVAVLAHAGKTIGGGLPELRHLLTEAGITDPLWHEVTKSKQAPKRARAAIDAGTDLIYVWGGDGMVQQVIDTVAGSNAVIAILPAGTANLLAPNPPIPRERKTPV